MTGDMLAPLCSLTGMQRLVLTQVDDAGVHLLAQLTKLTYLELWGPSDVSDAGLLQLAALKGLTHFVLYSLRLSGWNDTLMFDRVRAHLLGLCFRLAKHASFLPVIMPLLKFH